MLRIKTHDQLVVWGSNLEHINHHLEAPVTKAKDLFARCEDNEEGSIWTTQGKEFDGLSEKGHTSA